MMKNNTIETHYVYLAGNHKANSDWRKDFNRYNSELNKSSSIVIIGVDPFQRRIDENDPLAIVKRDMAILSDKRVSYVVLMSDQGNGVFSTGTSCEMILARSFGKPIVAITSRENDNIHPFTHHFATHIVLDITEATHRIRDDILWKRDYGGLEDDLALLNGYKFDEPDINPFFD